jgi:hypothetical protein
MLVVPKVASMPHPERPIAATILLALAGCTCDAAPRTEIPSLTARRTSSAPAIDGRLDDAAWTGAAWSEVFVDTMSGGRGALEARARIAWDDAALYVAFEVEDDFLRASGQGHDAHLWEEDAVELMIDPDSDGLSYVELQVSPTNLVFDTWFDARRAPQPFGHVEWSSGLRSAVALDGTANDDEDDEGWRAEIAIPWSAFSSIGTPVEPPRAGAEWRIAMYVLDARREGQAGVGWSPPLVGDFHVPDRFGRVRFAD